MTQLKGKVLKVLPKETGNGAKGQWSRCSFIIETVDQYPKKVCFSAYGDKADAAEKLTPNTLLDVHYNAESREYNNKWYTELKAWKWEVEKKNSQTEVTTNSSNTEEESSDLPF